MSNKFQNLKSKKLFFAFLFSIFYFLFLVPVVAESAVLYFEPFDGEYQVGDIFLVDIKINTQGECINVVSVELKFSQGALEVVDFSKGNSLITFWVEPPKINQESGLISFSGGIPGGYCGLVLGDSEGGALLGRIVFEVPGIIGEGLEEKSATVKFLNSSQVLLNDGLGTETELIVGEAIFGISSQESGPVKNEWQEEIQEDTIPPEMFEIETHQDPNVFDGKYFIIFATTDKQTGIDYYEVKEGRGDWQQANSPWVLEDQGLKSIIKVRAVDKAGNERIAEHIPEAVRKQLLFLIIILIIAMIPIAWWGIRKLRKGNKRNLN